MAPKGTETGANSHPSGATNITILQSFCDKAGQSREISSKPLICVDYFERELCRVAVNGG
jgi:hypothetical protein